MSTITADPASWRVLVVDDKQPNFDLVAAILEPRGAVVSMTTSGLNIPQLIAEHAINLLLLDIAMPEYSGWQIYEDLRSQPAYDGILIIGVTALAMPSDISKARAMGFSDLITKPYRPKELIERIVACINK